MSSVSNCLSTKLTDLGYEPEAKCCLTQGLGALCALALVIIACIGVAGAFPGSTMGWVSVGIASTGFLLNLAGGHLSHRKIELMIAAFATAAVIAVSVVGGLGILAASHVGWGIIGISLASALAQVIAKQIQAPKQNQHNS